MFLFPTSHTVIQKRIKCEWKCGIFFYYYFFWSARISFIVKPFLEKKREFTNFSKCNFFLCERIKKYAKILQSHALVGTLLYNISPWSKWILLKWTVKSVEEIFIIWKLLLQTFFSSILLPTSLFFFFFIIIVTPVIKNVNNVSNWVFLLLSFPWEFIFAI